jgi:hypothetical protein
MDIFRRIKSLREKGDIRGAEELERLVEKRRAALDTSKVIQKRRRGRKLYAVRAASCVLRKKSTG